MSKKPRERLYDAACERLAKHFLANEPLDTPENRKSLAINIQDAVEDWFFCRRPVEDPDGAP